MAAIPIIPNQGDQDIAEAKLDALGWRLANVIKGNFVAVRDGQSGEVESQSAATLPSLVEAVKLREEVLARQEEAEAENERSNS